MSGSARQGRPLLAPLAVVFGAVSRLRNGLYDAAWLPVHRLGVPVVSVGNLTVGGTGKTPLVALLARRFAAAGRRPAVVSHGYGGRNARRPHAPPLLVSAGDGHDPLVDSAECGDEPALLASQLPNIPVVVGRDRVTAGRLAVERCHADLIVLDDGFQHRQLHRDFDLVAVDTRSGLADVRLLPVGPFREGPGALSRAHAVVGTRADDERAFADLRQRVAARFPALPVFRARHRPAGWRLLGEGAAVARELRPTAELRGRQVAAFAGLADPEVLRQSLEGLGAQVVRFDARPDHHPYRPDEVERLVAAGRRAGAGLVFTTAKDAARLPAGHDQAPLAVLEIEMAVEDLDRLLERAVSLCIPGPRSDAAGAV